MENLDNLVTESVNENSKNIDALSTIEMVKIINSEDVKVAEAVGKESENIAKAIDEIAKRYIKGGRLIYIGAGSSGRMGTLDAVELTPTYNVSPERAFGLIAGGKEAMYRAVEGAEDKFQPRDEAWRRCSHIAGLCGERRGYVLLRGGRGVRTPGILCGTGFLTMDKTKA